MDTLLICVSSVAKTEDDIRDVNLEQMYDGKTRLGKDITPSYQDDPYWDTHGFRGNPPGDKAAQAYSDWKDDITPSPRRRKGTPNLYINGFFHRSIRVNVTGQTIKWQSDFDDANDISDKFENIYGLGGVYKEVFLRTYLTPVLKDKIFRTVKLLMK